MPNGHSTYLKFGNRNSGLGEPDEMQFFEEQLFDAKHAMFAATTVREIKFLQSKIDYLQKEIIAKQKKERAKFKKKKNVRSKRPKIIRFRPRAML